MTHYDLDIFLALSARYLGPVTCYLCLIKLKENWKWDAEMTYNEYMYAMKRYHD